MSALLAAAALSGCTASGAGDAAPAPAPASSALPPRPQEIRIDDLDPCAAFTAEHLRQLDIGGPRFRPADEETGPLCQWRHSPYEPIEGYLIMRTTDQGPETALSSPLGAEVISVSGFPAVETKGFGSGDGSDHCIVLVGVAAGQTLQVQYDYNGTALPMTRELACQKARTAAELAMQTLIDQAGG
ncbi:MAG: DUF3558 domain-containing protein [Pseudonocardia sp.]